MKGEGPRCDAVTFSSAVPEGRESIVQQAIHKGEGLLHVPKRLLHMPDAALRDTSIRRLLDHAVLSAWSVQAAHV